MLVVRNKLDETRLVGLKWLPSRSDDLEVCGKGGFWGERTDLPCRGLSYTDLGLANALRLFVCGDDMADDTRNLQFFCGLHISFAS